MLEVKPCFIPKYHFMPEVVEDMVDYHDFTVLYFCPNQEIIFYNRL